jgi:capsule polysaccharide export protein KpsE/RkpR
MEVSSIYLESLKTYEQLAGNNTLFQKAAARFQLRALTGSGPIEALRRRVLRVAMVRNSRILEIAVTLPDPAKAQAVAQFVAEQTVELNRSISERSGTDMVDAVEPQVREAETKLAKTDKAWSDLLAHEPVDDLQNAVYEAEQRRGSLEERIADLRVDLADHLTAEEESRVRARLNESQRQLEALNRDMAAQQKMLAGRMARRDSLEAERRADQGALAAIRARLRDTQTGVGFRGEQLAIIDPGVVPERPSSPNLSLNLAVALLLGLMLPLVYLMLDLALQQQRSPRGGVLEALAHTRHE